MRTDQQRAAPTRRPKNRRAQIALAAAELFCERGYHGVSIDEIAEAVGITGPAVYRHFPNKYAMLVHATQELADTVRAATEAGSTPVGPDAARVRLDELLGALARLGVEHRKVGGLYQWEGRYLTPDDRATFRADVSALVDRIVQPLRALRPELTDPAAGLLARAALSAVGSLSTHRATLARARAEDLLRRAGWALLTADAALLTADPTGLTADLAGFAPLPDPDPPVRPGGAPGAVVSASRREVLMAEALRLFHLVGYHAVAMEDIGRAAGINASSVYRHFPSKADLLAAVYYRAADRVASSTAAALAKATDPADAMGRLVESYTRLLFDQNALISVYQAENNNLPERDRHELRKAQRLHVEEWVRLLVETRPELASAEARILVHAAINLITDLARLGRFDRSTGFDRSVVELARTLLRAT